MPGSLDPERVLVTGPHVEGKGSEVGDCVRVDTRIWSRELVLRCGVEKIPSTRFGREDTLNLRTEEYRPASPTMDEPL